MERLPYKNWHCDTKVNHLIFHLLAKVYVFLQILFFKNMPNDNLYVHSYTI
jgi:hypothetical protein